MTISTTSSHITYLGNGATTVFTFPFVGVSAADLEVIYTNASGVQTTLNPSTYTLVINTVPVGELWGIGGSVTYPISGTPIAAGTEITINRIVPYEQNVSIANQGAFYPSSVEQGLDLLELQIQQIEDDLGYVLRTPIVDPSPPNVLPAAALRAGGYLAFDSLGQPIVLFNTISPVSVGVFPIPRIVNVTTTTTIGVMTSDSFGGVSIYQSGAAVTTVQLPVGYGPYPVFDASGNAQTKPIKVLPPAGKLINGLASFELLFNYQSATFFNDGNQILVQ